MDQTQLYKNTISYTQQDFTFAHLLNMHPSDTEGINSTNSFHKCMRIVNDFFIFEYLIYLNLFFHIFFNT